MQNVNDDKLAGRPTREELKRIRNTVASIADRNGGPAPHGALLELAGAAGSAGLVTVDLQARETLGAPVVIVQVAREPQSDPHLSALSPRERTVVTLIARGLANKQIAAKMGITVLTVKDHVHRILTKTGLPNRAAIAAACRGSGGEQPAE